jgi:signal transduction histidine kinase
VSGKVAVGAALVIGGIATGLTSWALGMTVEEAAELAAIASGTALGFGLFGAALVLSLRRRRLGTQITVVALTGVGAVGAGAATAAKQMFLTSHDLSALIVILVAAGAVGIAFSLALGARVTEVSRSLERAALRIGTGERVASIGGPPAGELSRLAERLEETSVQLEQTRAREAALDASRRELVAWVSHDLRTPLAGIRAMAEALEDGVAGDSETVARYHHGIRVEADRLAALVDDLFELSRINAGTLSLQLERVSLSDVVSDAIAGASGIARTKGVRLEGRMANACELELSTSEIARALRNVLENAIRHTPCDGAVWVEADADDRHAYVSVVDACGGIPDSDIDRVFDVAFRGETARTKKDDGGAGLGLAIARGIVEAHKGVIAVRNEGRGCRFTIRLPLSQSQPAGESP